jgi:hypothetical protein
MNFKERVKDLANYLTKKATKLKNKKLSKKLFKLPKKKSSEINKPMSQTMKSFNITSTMFNTKKNNKQ